VNTGNEKHTVTAVLKKNRTKMAAYEISMKILFLVLIFLLFREVQKKNLTGINKAATCTVLLPTSC